MEQKALEFRDQYNNTHIDEDGYYGAQCWDVVARYAREKYGCPSFPTVTGGAAGLFTNTAGIISQYFDRVANNPNDANQIPPNGAIIVWGTVWSPPYGHTAIKLAGGVGQNMTVFEQNGNNPGGNAYQKSRNYTGVIGWLVPKEGAAEMKIANNITYAEMNRIHRQMVGNWDMTKGYWDSIQNYDFSAVIRQWATHPNSDTAMQQQLVGENAIRDRWDQQIYSLQDQLKAANAAVATANANLITLQNQVNDLGSRPTKEQLAALQKQIDDANKQAIEAQANYEKAKADYDKIKAEQTKNEETVKSVTQIIGEFIKKYFTKEK